MTLNELMLISAACRTDAEFLTHEEVRRAYWQALDKSNGHKMKKYGKCSPGRSFCTKCGNDEIQARIFSCAIPGSLPDAVEALRAQAAEVFNKWTQWKRPKTTEEDIKGDEFYRRLLFAMNQQGFHDTRAWFEVTPRRMFSIFVAALGTVEVPGWNARYLSPSPLPSA